MTQRAWTLKERYWDEMPQMLRKQHWMKNLLQQEGLSEILSHWKKVKRRTSHRQLWEVLLCGTQKSVRSQTSWRMGTVVTGNEWRGQDTPRQRDMGPRETTHRQGHHTGQMGLKSEIGIQWSSRQIQSRLCGKKLQTRGRTGLLWDFCAYL